MLKQGPTQHLDASLVAYFLVQTEDFPNGIW